MLQLRVSPQRFLGLFAFGYVFDRQQDGSCLYIRIENLAGVEQHHLPSDSIKVVGHLKIPERGARRENILQQLPEFRYIPLSVPQVVNETPLRLLLRGKGAFTGAIERSAGCFEQAHGGTLFLDEIGEMPQSTQPKLLRDLEDLKVRRLGGKHEIRVDARALAATSQDLEKHLREELYYRLSVFRIVVPPLRERKEDIPAIAAVMLQNLNKKHGTRLVGVDDSVLDLLQRYDWPGNVRELRNVLERAAIMAGQGLVGLKDMPSPELGLSPGPFSRQSSGLDSRGMPKPGHQLAELEEKYIALTLEHVGGNRKQAAEMLGISLSTLQSRIAGLREDGKSAGS